MGKPKNNPESQSQIEGELSLAELTDSKADKLQRTVALLKRQNSILADALEQSRQQHRVVRIQPVPSKRSKSEFVRVIIPDTHGSAIDPVAAGIFLSDLRAIDPDEIVMGGDHIDAGGFLAQHHTLGYVAQTEYSYEDDIACANDFLDRVQKNAPRAKIHYIEGNHERRVETWCVTESLRNTKDAEMLRRLLAPQFKLRLAERGIQYYRQSEHYHGLRIPGAIRLGKCYFWHSVSTAKSAAPVNLRQFSANVVYFHTHRRDAASGVPINKGDIGAWNPGCLCKMQPLWQHTRPTDWTHGFGIQLIARNANFLHINIPIINGQSLLMPLLKR